VTEVEGQVLHQQRVARCAAAEPLGRDEPEDDHRRHETREHSDAADRADDDDWRDLRFASSRQVMPPERFG